MNPNTYKQFINNCKNFIIKMQQNNIPKGSQYILLKNYIAIYNIDNNTKINLSDKQICQVIKLVS